jgi:hypothetical protein
MPQATDEQRALMNKWFGNPIDDGPPYRFLMARGYQEWAGMLIKPTPAHSVSEYEWACIEFLCFEWDYGFDPALRWDRPVNGGA